MDKKFKLGRTVMTTGVVNMLEKDEKFSKFVATSLGRYINCDWGDISVEDAQLNYDAVKKNDYRIFAVYEKSNYKIWIITEADRSVTTILFPDEY